MRNKLLHFAINHPLLGHYIFRIIRVLKTKSSQKGELSKYKELGFSPKAILDVGANRGEWSWYAKSVYTEAEFCLIEPQAEMAPFLNNFCSVFSNAFWILAGAGSSKDQLELKIWNDLAGSSFLPQQSDDFQHMPSRSVPIIEIDQLVIEKKIRIPDLIKIDVQGFELEVLKGSYQCFGKTEIFIIETSLFRFLPNQPLFYEIVEFMHENGYVVYNLFDLKSRPVDGALGQVDICFVKEDSFLRKSHKWC